MANKTNVKCRVQTTTIRIVMSEYRFHLQKYSYGSKISCPNCGKSRCFVRYVDKEGIIRFPDMVGKCDHENSCGYHYAPREYFHDNPNILHAGSQGLQKSFHPTVKTSVPVSPTFIYLKVVERSLADYGKNPLSATCAEFSVKRGRTDFLAFIKSGLLISGAVLRSIGRQTYPAR